MFTGIVEEMGTIQKIERGSQSAVLSICCEKVLEGTQIGEYCCEWRVSDRDKPAK